MKTNNLKNSSLTNSLSSSKYVSFKKSDKKRRKKNSYTDKYIDKKKFKNELVEMAKSKKLLRSGNESQKSVKKLIYNDIKDANGKNNYNAYNKITKTDNNKPNRQVLKKNHSYQHYNIKFHFFPKNKDKYISPTNLSIKKEKIQMELSTNNIDKESDNLNSKIILINNNIDYISTNANEGKKDINIILNNKISKNYKNIYHKEETKEIISSNIKSNKKVNNIIIENDNNKKSQNDKIKNLLTSNISTITNNISNVYSNTEQSMNSNLKIISENIQTKVTNLKCKINEYCYKSTNKKKEPNNIIINDFSLDTLSKEKIITNYNNNDFDINVSDIKKNEYKNKNEYSNSNSIATNNNNGGNYLLEQTNKKNNQNYATKIKIEENSLNSIKHIKCGDNSKIIYENNMFDSLNKLIFTNKKEDTEIFSRNNNDSNSNNLYNKKNNLNESIPKNEYKIYEVNTFRILNKEENSNNINEYNDNEEIIKNNEVKNIDEKKDVKNYLYLKNNNQDKNIIMNMNIYLENKSELNQKMNLDGFLKRTKEKLNQIRNNYSIEKNNNNKRKIKSTLNYILKQNEKPYNEICKSNENEEIQKEKNILENIKTNYQSNNKYIIRTSNRMQNIISNLNDTQKRKKNCKKISYKNLDNTKDNNIPSIKSIVDQKKLEVFDEDEFIQIKKRNFSSTKVNQYIMNKNLKYLDKTIKINNINEPKYSINKTYIEENILPPNNLNLKPILNQNIVKTILKKLGKPESLITFVKDRPGHDMRYAIDPTKIHSELGWLPETKFEDGIEKTIKWYLDNKDWWQRIISGEYQEYFDKYYSERL